MLISELFNTKKAVYSFEIFPPKVDASVSKIYDTLEGLSDLNPDYISVTYSAGGGSNNSRSVELASLVKHKYGVEALAHLTCINSTKDQVENAIEALKQNKIENILALRGDRIEGAVCSDFKHASDLVKFVKDRANFDISGACYPEGHPEADSIDADIENLKYKIDAGVKHLNSQLFYDNDDFYRFLDKARATGITVPIQAGIMPLVKKTTAERTITMAGTKIPAKIARMIAKFADDPASLQEAGIAYATDQIVDLLSAGVDGVHIYVMNNVYVAKRITENVKSILDGINK